ncbi:hypothetical protein 16Q_009c [Pseudomonas phage 16Q]|nr:hypothetical protein 16Q_009c [Pseudomonas phage 16Q]
MSIISWLFGENKVVHTHLKAKIPAVKSTRKWDSLVGEPVISFITSLEETPKRYLVRNVTFEHFGGHGTGAFDTYKMKDTKTGDVYEAYFNTHTGQISLVLNLPFELNILELRALTEAFKNRRLPAILRRHSIHSAAKERERLAKIAGEASSRAEFSKRFQ